MAFTTAEIAKHIDGEVLGDASATLKGFAPADSAKAGDLTFAENDDFFVRAEKSAATAIIADKRFTSSKKIVIRVAERAHRLRQSDGAFFSGTDFRRRRSSHGCRRAGRAN